MFGMDLRSSRGGCKQTDKQTVRQTVRTTLSYDVMVLNGTVYQLIIVGGYYVDSAVVPILMNEQA